MDDSNISSMAVRMTDNGNPPKIWIAEIKHESRDGFHSFTSPFIEGLFLGSRDPKKILSQLKPTIELLIKNNLRLDVTVELGSGFDDFCRTLCCDDMTISNRFAVIREVREAA